MMQFSTLLNIFKTLRDILEIVSKDFAILEHFLCKLYESKQESLDIARFWEV